jgi:hypothetical protein
MKSIITFLILTIFCSRSSYSQSSSWTTTNKWVYKNGEKFFPIGIWYPRGYDPSSPYTIIEDNDESFNSEFSYFNTLYIDEGNEKNYMINKVLLVGNAKFREYFVNSIEHSTADKAIDAANIMCSYWKSTSPSFDHIYILDEPLSGLINMNGIDGNADSLYNLLSNWKSKINISDPGTLTFLDFVKGCNDWNDPVNPWACSNIGSVADNFNFDIGSHQHYNVNGNAINNTAKFVNGLRNQSNRPALDFSGC